MIILRRPIPGFGDDAGMRNVLMHASVIAGATAA
jgi:hypothetical protein